MQVSRGQERTRRYPRLARERSVRPLRRGDLALAGCTRPAESGGARHLSSPTSSARRAEFCFPVSTARVLESPLPAGPHLARPYVRRMDLAPRGEQTDAAHGVGYAHNFPRALNALRAATARLADGGDFQRGLQDRATTSLAPRSRARRPPKVSGFRDSEPIEDSHRSRLTSVEPGAARLPHSDPPSPASRLGFIDSSRDVTRSARAAAANASRVPRPRSDAFESQLCPLTSACPRPSSRAYRRPSARIMYGGHSRRHPSPSRRRCISECIVVLTDVCGPGATCERSEDGGVSRGNGKTLSASRARRGCAQVCSKCLSPLESISVLTDILRPSQRMLSPAEPLARRRGPDSHGPCENSQQAEDSDVSGWRRRMLRCLPRSRRHPRASRARPVSPDAVLHRGGRVVCCT